MATSTNSDTNQYTTAALYQRTSRDLRPEQSRKRNRDEDEDDSELVSLSLDSIDDGPTKPRRVNPQSLAIRLGPELVQEMEAYITPGAIMPCFAVRKELQERYAVDRRHIYDYFHSRGLRVSKEDKYSNLKRSRANAQPRAIKPARATKPAAKPKLEKRKTVKKPPRRILGALSVNIPTERQSQSSEMDSILLSGCQQPVIPDDSISSQSSSQSRSESPSPITGSLFADDRFDFRMSCLSPAPLEMSSYVPPDDCALDFPFSIADASGIHDDVPDLEYPEIPFAIADSCLTTVDSHLLTEYERSEQYNLINVAIGPAHGLEESAGTYKAHMGERSSLYFERLFSRARAQVAIQDAHAGNTTSTQSGSHTSSTAYSEDSAGILGSSSFASHSSSDASTDWIRTPETTPGGSPSTLVDGLSTNPLIQFNSNVSAVPETRHFDTSGNILYEQPYNAQNTITPLNHKSSSSLISSSHDLYSLYLASPSIVRSGTKQIRYLTAQAHHHQWLRTPSKELAVADNIDFTTNYSPSNERLTIYQKTDLSRHARLRTSSAGGI